MPEIDGDHTFGFDTLAVHAGQRPDPAVRRHTCRRLVRA